jgi:hypothetical protein
MMIKYKLQVRGDEKGVDSKEGYDEVDVEFVLVVN